MVDMKKSFIYVSLVRKGRDGEYMRILYEETALSNKERERKMNVRESSDLNILKYPEPLGSQYE